MNIFIDCGGHLGQSIEYFKSRTSKKWKIYCFEVHPANADVIKEIHPDVEVIRKAVWVHNNKVKLYNSIPKYYESSSIMKNKRIKRHAQRPNDFMVNAIDFSQWVKQFSHDYVVCKMNIEGAEYQVLNKMYEEGTIKIVNKLMVDWHYKKIGYSGKKHDACLARLQDISHSKWGLHKDGKGRLYRDDGGRF